ncbi:MAG: response regulator [Phycisphaerales bacterium]
MHRPLVLLADDEAPITCVVGQRLEAAGFGLVIARDGTEALELALRNPPAVLVTDLQMPRMSGLELATRLKQESATAAIPVIMLTARGYILNPDQLAKTNIRHLMSKPFSAKDVLRRVIELIGAPAAAESAA